MPSGRAPKAALVPPVGRAKQTCSAAQFPCVLASSGANVYISASNISVACASMLVQSSIHGAPSRRIGVPTPIEYVCWPNGFGCEASASRSRAALEVERSGVAGVQLEGVDLVTRLVVVDGDLIVRRDAPAHIQVRIVGADRVAAAERLLGIFDLEARANCRRSPDRRRRTCAAGRSAALSSCCTRRADPRRCRPLRWSSPRCYCCRRYRTSRCKPR